MLEDILQAEAAALRDQLADHDTAAFTRRLARRIAEAGEPPAPDRLPSVDRGPRSERAPVPVRPLPHRARRRRPTPIIPAEPALTPAAMVQEVRLLCDNVLRSTDIDRLLDFAADYNDAGARTFACLLYSMDKWDSALYWWRFAAGAGDELAAHLLAMHHAAVGYTPDARLWRTIARLMKYTPDRHLPRPVRPTIEYGQGCGHAAVRRTALEAFIHSKHLPGGLLAR